MKGTFTGLMVLLPALAFSWSADVHATDIYKTYDENGDPVYTDQPPTPESKPISLRELSVVEAPNYGPVSSNQQSQSDSENDQPAPNELRRMFRDFRLVSPTQDENIWGTGNTVTLTWDAGRALSDGMSVMFYIDGQPVSDQTQQTTLTSERLDRGTHMAKVDLMDSQGRVIMSTPAVTFFIMQQTVNQQRRGPAG